MATHVINIEVTIPDVLENILTSWKGPITTTPPAPAAPPLAEPAPEAATPAPSPAVEPETGSISVQDAKDAAMTFRDKHGADEARAILKKFGLTKLSEMEESQADAVYRAFKEAN